MMDQARAKSVAHSAAKCFRSEFAQTPTRRKANGRANRHTHDARVCEALRAGGGRVRRDAALRERRGERGGPKRPVRRRAVRRGHRPQVPRPERLRLPPGPRVHRRRCHRVQSLNPLTNEVVTTLGKNSAGRSVEAAYCIEKDLFDPFTFNDVLATIIAFVSTALGSGCGIGGGGLLVPGFITVIGLSPKHAIPLSKATIFGNAIAIYLFNFYRKHPTKRNAPIINYAVSAIMEPMTLIGSIFGVMMNHIFPDWLILALLISLLSFITYKTCQKGNKIRDKEIKKRRELVKSALKGRPHGGGRGRLWSIYRHFDVEIAAKRWLAITRRNKKLRAVRAEDEKDFESLPPLQLPVAAHNDREISPLLQGKARFGTFSHSVDDDALTATRRTIERREANPFPVCFVLTLVVSWLVVLVQALLRGGHGSGSLIGVQCNSPDYWLLTILPLGILVGLTLWIGYHLRLENRLKVLSGYNFVDGDIHWTKSRVLIFPAYCVVAGIAAGLLGIGGGMVKGPIMLEMGILPPVQSATASYMILFTSSSTTLQFAIAGQFPGSLQYDYVAWFAFVGFLGGLCGQKVVAYLVKKYKRESIMVYLLAVVIGSSAVAMGIIGFQSTIQDIEKGVHLGFNGICDST
ncbi:Membrane protein, partial [Globisporangium splendens]